MKSFVLFSLTFILPMCMHGQDSAEFDFSPVEVEIENAIDNKVIPSVVVAVAKDGKIIYEKAFGYADIKKQVKATTSTSYEIASLSKPFTATGIMLLDHMGKIDIEMSADQYIPPLKFKVAEVNSSEVRIIDLLNHTSGLGNYFQLSYSDENTESDDFRMAFNKYGTLFHQSGQICEYSNLGYGLLGYIIEKQGKTIYSEFMMKELFIPLGLENTFIGKPKKRNKHIAQKYDANMHLLPEIINNTIGAGNIYSSIHDLILFGLFHLKSDNYEKLLSSEELEMMHSYINKNTLYHYYDSTYYGLGWYFKNDDNGYKIVWHEGGMMGVSSMLKLIPEENIAIAVIINTFNKSYCQKITNQLNKVVMPDYNPSPISEIANYTPYTKDSTLIGEWAGFIKVGQDSIPCTLNFNSDRNIIINYLDYTYRSYFTQNNPIPNKTFLLNGLVNQKSFIGMFPGDLPSNDIRHEFSQFLSLKLIKNDNVLSGQIVALAAADREYYAYPYYIRLEKNNQ
ncbi:serine hydrolase domain-containing protein [Roseimarinus sediminis]|uniref:serine hydrolase domain-containing protein n=1 Tax=Roseimarinus sediminis TaxID=1610899 RepID=UPI003D1E48D5